MQIQRKHHIHLVLLFKEHPNVAIQQSCAQVNLKYCYSCLRYNRHAALARAPICVHLCLGDALTYLGSGGSSTHGTKGREAKSRGSSGVICGTSRYEGGCSGGRGGWETHHNRREGDREWLRGPGKLSSILSLARLFVGFPEFAALI